MDLSSRYYTAEVKDYFDVNGIELFAWAFVTQPLRESGEYMEPEYEMAWVTFTNDDEEKIPDIFLDSYVPASFGPSQFTWRFMLEAAIFQYIEKRDLWVRGDSKADRDDYNE
jgi:hypothetical protein